LVGVDEELPVEEDEADDVESDLEVSVFEDDSVVLLADAPPSPPSPDFAEAPVPDFFA
jgi:hypothetical protein